MRKFFYRSSGALVISSMILSPVVASAATNSANTTINATIGSTISITTSGTVALGVTPTSGSSASSVGDVVTVSTNNSTGYNLSLADSDATTTLTSGGNSITAHTGTFAAPTTLADNSWGYRVDNSGTFGAGPTAAQTNQANLTGTWAGVPASGAPQQLKSTSTTASADATNVWYGVKVDTTQPTGVYTDSVTYTATTNP